MGTVKNAIYQVDNGVDFDEIHFRTKASQVKIQDANNRFNSEDVEGALNELFQYANNGKSTIANSVGSPLLATDSFGTMGTKIGTIKSNVATAITNKGIATNGNESFDSFVSKIGQINTGKKYAQGSGMTDSNGCWTVANLTFAPKIVAVMLYNDNVYLSTRGGFLFNADITVRAPRYANGDPNVLSDATYNNSAVFFTSNGFYSTRAWDYYRNTAYSWYAWE